MSKQVVWTASIIGALVVGGLAYFVALQNGLLGTRYVPAPQEQSQTAPQDQATKDEARLAPSLDIVRIEPDGRTLVAGRAAPESQVALKRGEALIGETKANLEGEWVILTDEPLNVGTSEITLEATLPDGTVVPSNESIVVQLEEGATAKPLVVVMDKDAPTRVLQQPDAPAAESPSVVAEAAQTATETATQAAEKAADAAQNMTQTAAQMAANAAKKAEEAAASAAGSVVEKLEDKLAATADTASAPTSTQAEPSPARAPEPAKVETPAALLQVQTIETETSGKFLASGSADANAQVQLYVENQLIGDAITDANGRWTIVGERQLNPGDYAVRIDQLGADGTVTGRAELTFNQAVEIAANAPLPESVQLEKLEIKRGDNLWRISRRLYGEGRRYTVIYDANRQEITNPNLIFPGQVFVIPADKAGN